MKYLALGDSYTIGELVSYQNNFPNQSVKLVNNQGVNLVLDKIIAKTGWTTDELIAQLAKENPPRDYDWVTLLIGVNNQYRGRSIEEYNWQFYTLLCQSILYAKGKPEHVIVLSIPDWGMTPFNTDRNKVVISKQIDAFNEINKHWSDYFGCHYIEITRSTREHGQLSEYLTEDKLHLSSLEYNIWAHKIAEIILDVYQK